MVLNELQLYLFRNIVLHNYVIYINKRDTLVLILLISLLIRI